MSVGVLILKTHGTMKGPFLCPRFATGCGSPSGGESHGTPGWEQEVGAGGEVLESPEDTRTAATAGAGRQAGTRWAPVPPAGRRTPGFHRNCPATWPRVPPLPLSSTVLLKRVVLVLLGARAGETPRDRHSRDTQPRTAAYNGLSRAICNNSCNSLGRWS